MTGTQGWLPIPVIEYRARARHAAGPGDGGRQLLHHVQPRARRPIHVQVCGTTPCMLRGSDDVLSACYKRGLRKGHTTADGCSR